MERPKTVRVLAAPGMLIRHRTASGAAALRNHSDPEQGELQAAVYISDSGLWDGMTRKVFAEGPVEIPNDRHTRRLIKDGDLVIVEAEPPAQPKRSTRGAAHEGETE